MVQEELIENGERVHHWSDAGMKIRQEETGTVYDDAVDVVPCRYTYSETDEPVDGDEDAGAEDYENALARLGVTV